MITAFFGWTILMSAVLNAKTQQPLARVITVSAKQTQVSSPESLTTYITSQEPWFTPDSCHLAQRRLDSRYTLFSLQTPHVVLSSHSHFIKIHSYHPVYWARNTNLERSYYHRRSRLHHLSLHTYSKGIIFPLGCWINTCFRDVIPVIVDVRILINVIQMVFGKPLEFNFPAANYVSILPQ